MTYSITATSAARPLMLAAWLLLATACGAEKGSAPAASVTPAATPAPSQAPAAPAKAPAAPAKAPAAPAKAPAAQALEARVEPTPAEIDALAKIARADGFKSMGPQSKLWTALFQLKHWHLMTFPDSKAVPPGLNIETHQGKKWVMAFTDPSRLREYATLRKQLNADGTMLGMSIPTQTSFDYFESLVGIEGVIFNQGPLGLTAPMGNLRAIHTHLKKQGAL